MVNQNLGSSFHPDADPPYREDRGCRVILEDQLHTPGTLHVEVSRACPRRELGPGWWPLVDEAFDAVAQSVPAARVLQVKQKMGGLRVYVRERSAGNPTPGLSPRTPAEMAAFLAASAAWVDPLATLRSQLARIEARSFETCESCGALGTVGWGPSIRTLCDSCGPPWAATFHTRIEGFLDRLRGEGPDLPEG